MGFLNKLGKSFIRSAVNQVGRDSGKVVSNKIFGDKHATAVKVSSVTKSMESDGSLNHMADRSTLLSNGYNPDTEQPNLIYAFLVLIGASIFPILGPLYYLLIGAQHLMRHSTKFYKVVKEEVYVTDKRYKDGQRLDGYTDVRKEHEHPVKASASERMIYRTRGIICIILFCGISYLQYRFFFG